MQRHAGGVHGLQQRVVGAREEDDDVDFGAAARAQRVADALHVEEQEALREREVLLQQPVAGEAMQGLRQQGFVVLEAGGFDALAVQRLVPRGGALGRQHQHAQRVAADQLVQAVGDVVDAGAVQPQVLQRDLREVEAGRGAQPQAQAGAVLAPLGQRGHGQVGGVREVLHLRQLQRPQRDVVRGAELAGRGAGLAGVAQHRGAARQARPGGQRRVAQVGLQLRHQHRGCGRQELRVDDLQQPLREARELGVELQLDAAGQEREAFEQAFDVGVGDLQALDAQPGSDLRELLRELGAHLAQMAQFLVVVAEQARVHVSRSRCVAEPAAREAQYNNQASRHGTGSAGPSADGPPGG